MLWLGPETMKGPPLEESGPSGPQDTAAAQLAYLPSGWWLVIFGECRVSSGVTGTVNMVVVVEVGVVAASVVGASHTDQITYYSAR